MGSIIRGRTWIGLLFILPRSKPVVRCHDDGEEIEKNRGEDTIELRNTLKLKVNIFLCRTTKLAISAAKKYNPRNSDSDGSVSLGILMIIHGILSTCLAACHKLVRAGAKPEPS
jgi:hypothetical protein